MDINQLLNLQIQHGASDMHLTAGQPAICRINGDLVRIKSPIFSENNLRQLAYSMLSAPAIEFFEREWQLDFAYSLPGVSRFRINLYQQNRGLALAIRQIPLRILSLEQLGLPPVVTELALKARGLVLVTGPSGCGKSTTLAAMVNLYNKQQHAHIITIEDPIEFIYQPQNCLINQREVGQHTKSFAAALRAALRQDPDVILVGEMRDLETISLALEAAQTGHLVLATLHTSGAIETIDRIINVFPPLQQAVVRTMLAETLQGVIAQTLCRQKNGTSRVVATEIMLNTPAIANLIRENKLSQIANIMKLNHSRGMTLLDDNLAELVRKGTISQEEAAAKANNPQQINTALD